MFDDLRDLYQEVILDHGRKPRNFRRLDDADATARGDNPMCGDRIELFIRRADDGTIADAAFQGRGCAISTASASLMTEAIKGKPVAEVEALFQDFHELLTTTPPPARDFGKLAVLSGVREFPARVKCATLAWHTLHNAIIGAQDPARTE